MSGPYGENPIPFETVLATLQELKFDGLELGGFNGYPNPQNHPTPTTGPGSKASLRAMAWRSPASRRICGASICSIRATPSQYVASFKTNCDFAVDLGIKGIRVDTVQPPTLHREADYDDLLKRLVATWDRCIGYAGDQGLYVAWEFEPGFAFNKPSDIQRVLDKLQHDNFGVLYDTCHGQMVAVVGARQEGEPGHAARRAARADRRGCPGGSTTST